MGHHPNNAAVPSPMTTNNTAATPPNATSSATTAKPDFQYSCNICKVEFPTAFRLPCHHRFHIDPLACNLVELNPTRPIRREFLKASKGRRIPSPLGIRSPVLAPNPISVALPPGTDRFDRHWWAIGLTNGDLRSRKPVLKLLSSRGVQIPICKPNQTKGIRGDVRGGKGKEVIRSGPEKTKFASSSINTPVISPPEATVVSNSSYNCNFCKRTFYNPYALSAHYGGHKDLPASQWLEHGPHHSKIRKLISKAVDEARRLNPSTGGSQAVESGPIRDVPQPGMYPSGYPQWDLGPTDGSSSSGEAVTRTQGHEALGVENEEVSLAVHGKDPLPDLNKPYSPGRIP